jgi:salicylate 5-hydroxylase large subunit
LIFKIQIYDNLIQLSFENQHDAVSVFPGDTMREQPIQWERSDTSRVPFAVYTDKDSHKKEMERLFYKNHWSYLGLEVEIPSPGDFKRTVIGERSVIMTRSHDGQIHAVENVCAHRGMAFCRERHGNKKELVCPYHQWSYALDGKLQGVPFRRGVRQDGKVNGGMPADFDPKNHSLTQLKVATRGGVVFASFDPSVESLEDYMGPTILKYFDRLFNGRKLTLLGYNRLLHTWFVTFGLWRADNKSELRMDSHHRHAAMISTRGTGGQAGGDKAQVTQVGSFKESMQLNDPSFLDIVPEEWWRMGEQMPTAVMLTLFPSVIFQQQVNSHIQPDGHGAFDFVWTHFGFEDDTPEMTNRRLRQSNLFGPAGFVSADDGEVIEFSQEAFETNPKHRMLVELGGRDVGETDHMVTETLIRGMYEYWRKVMGDR